MASKQKTKKSKAVASKKEPVQKVSPYSPKQIKKFVEEVKVEFTKIVWPDKKVTLGLTGIVVVLAMLVSVYLGAVDFVLGKGVSTILRG